MVCRVKSWNCSRLLWVEFTFFSFFFLRGECGRVLGRGIIRVSCHHETWSLVINWRMMKLKFLNKIIHWWIKLIVKLIVSDFTDDELRIISEAGATAVGLGPHRLRVETATIALLSTLMMWSDSQQLESRVTSSASWNCYNRFLESCLHWCCWVWSDS